MCAYPTHFTHARVYKSQVLDNVLVLFLFRVSLHFRFELNSELDRVLSAFCLVACGARLETRLNRVYFDWELK